LKHSENQADASDRMFVIFVRANIFSGANITLLVN